MNVKPWTRRERLTADRLNQTVAPVNQHLPIIAGPGIVVRQGSNGTIIELATPIVERQVGSYMVLNDGDRDIEPGWQMGITGPLHDPTTELEAFRFNISFKGRVPQAPADYSHWGIADEFIPIGGFGLLFVGGGVRAVQVNVSDITHYNAGVTDNNPTQLTSSNVAISRMLLPNTTTGLRWQYVTLNNTFPTEEEECS